VYEPQAVGGYGIAQRWITRILMFSAVGLGSFVLALWVIFPKPTPTGPQGLRYDSERLASYSISSTSDLVEAVISLGLHRSRQMDANVDAMSRTNAREVTARGWLADPGGDATPLKLLVFVAGKLAGSTETHGERPDVTRAHALTLGAEKHVSFQVSFDCSPGQQPMMIGLGTEKQYLRIKSPPCP
jgi:hypothetical protein